MMPIIECSCGMVMSVPVDGSRGCCIRCGGVELHILDRRAIQVPSPQMFLLASTAGCAPPLALAGVSSEVETIASGYSI
ncbi:MAG: hypothetical protein WD738_23605 [Pirellulales bacterium]